ncbi:capsule assembly Wzi family protein [Flavobacteriaceae bacterium TK19130]|nr:capsule assembly Wzi family protein [Thermobacterium salinum]
MKPIGCKFLAVAIAFIMLSVSSNAQDNGSLNFNGAIEVEGILGNDDVLPFWLRANTFAAKAEATNYVVTPDFSLSYAISERDSISIGASAYFHDGFNDTFQRNELFLRYRTSWLEVIAGSKRIQERFHGASIVADNFWMSGNARPLPGLLLQAPEYLKLTNSLRLDYALGHFFLNDDRVVQDAWVHYKRFGLSWSFSRKTSLVFEVEHYAQWSGTSPDFGKQPNDFSDFIDVFLASEGGENAADTDRRNATGEHMGLFNLVYQYKPAIGTYSIYHEHPIEDGSGTRLKNFPDGIWGIAFTANEKRYTSVLKAIVLEYIQTTDQSGRTGRSGNDNYFNGGVYRSGWSYEQQIIGLPFIQLNPNGIRIQNNRLRALHFGIVMRSRSFEYRLKSTAIENLGTYGEPFDPKQRALHNSIEISYETDSYGSFILRGGYDFLEFRDDAYGAGMAYRYVF